VTNTTPARQKSGLALFWAVTFTTTWAFWLVAILLGGPPTSPPTAIPFLLGGFGPVVGAIVIRIRRGRRREPVPAHTVRLRLGVRLFWVLPLLVLASGTVVGAAVLANLVGGPAVNLESGKSLMATAGGAVPFFIGMLVVGPLAEEPGWRGTAYPRLLASMGRLKAGLLLGVAWAIWHLPLFFISGTVQADLGLFSWSGLLFTLSVIPMALLTGYAYERAGVVAAIAVHFAVNTTMAMLGASSPITWAFVLAVQIIVAIVLLSLHRTRQPELPVQRSPRSHQVAGNL
jgi:membrane protease YdiL (CAAX protease family)